jgi:hypothetical protein
MKGAVANLALAAVSLVLALLAGEGALRVAGFQPGNPLERLINHRDDFLGYRMVPGMRETVPGPGGVYAAETVDLGFPDGIGFRDDGIAPPVDSVFIGDSYVWGFGVELADSLSERYEALTGGDAVNLGMTSWTSPVQYARVLERYGAPLKPRYAFVEALVQNDFGDLPNFLAWEASGSAKSYPEWMTDRVMRYEPDALGYQLRRLVYDHSALGRLLSDRIQFGIRNPDTAPDDAVAHVTGDGLDLYLNRAEFPESGAGADPEQVRLFRQALVSTRDIAVRHGIRLVVFVCPTKELVYQDRFPDTASRAARDWRYDVLLELLRETGIPHLDLLPVLRAAAADGGPQLYFARDTHWNARGHDVAARALAEFVATRCTGGECTP